MKIKTFFTILLTAFAGLCAFLIFADSGAGRGRIPPLAARPLPKVLSIASEAVLAEEGFDLTGLKAVNAASRTRIVGSVDPDAGYKFEIALTSKGAGIATVTLSEFDDRDPYEPVPFILLKPVTAGKKEINSLANGYFYLLNQRLKFDLGAINWNIVSGGRSGQVAFETFLKDANLKDIIKLTKTYSILQESYDVDCDITVENLTDEQLKVRFDIQGTAGVSREDIRIDSRKVMAAFINPEDKIASDKIDCNKLRKAKKAYLYTQATEQKREAKDDMLLAERGSNFIWAATTNKYFAALIRPVQADGQPDSRITMGLGQYYDPGLNDKKPDGDEDISFSLHTVETVLAPAGQLNAAGKYSLRLYAGPKDRDLFRKNEEYNRWGYFHSIDFRACCCPSFLIRPLAFGIMAAMKWMFTAMGPMGNYGVVIILLVFCVRLLMHPITKKSQVSMVKMQKLGPKIEQLKQKYANNKAELQKQIMAFYKEQGVSPFSSMLPMMIQMPIWISLWTAVNASIDMRGASFLPFWITDLSSPDALIRFSAFTIPLLNWQLDSFNLLPLLMGGVMYAQQKLMPHSSGASANPQAAQQQKMMMIMMPLMFPIILYKGPSGVNLYILSSITAGVIEQMVIRKHLCEKDKQDSIGLVSATSKTGGKAKKKKPKPFFKNTM